MKFGSTLKVLQPWMTYWNLCSKIRILQLYLLSLTKLRFSTKNTKKKTPQKPIAKLYLSSNIIPAYPGLFWSMTSKLLFSKLQIFRNTQIGALKYNFFVIYLIKTLWILWRVVCESMCMPTQLDSAPLSEAGTSTCCCLGLNHLRNTSENHLFKH